MSASCWVFSLLFCTSACSPRAPAITIGRLVIDAPPEFDARTSERDLLRRSVIDHLQHARNVTYARDSRNATHILRITLDERVALADAPPTWPIEVNLKPTGDLPEFVAAAAPVEKASLPVTLLAGFDEAWEVLNAMRTLDAAKDRTMIAALQDEDARLREFAIQRTGERRLKAAVAPLCKLLEQEENSTLLYKAIGALVAIGDPRAVEPLIALSHQKEAAFVLQVVFAVGAIGGRTAKAYLVTLASGHPNEEIQRGAKDALDELARRSGAAQR